MRLAITGSHGFLGWHTACRVRALCGIEPLRLSRQDFADTGLLAERLQGMDTVIHLAGVNRAESDDALRDSNVAIAKRLSDALERNSAAVHLIYGNSIQAERDSAYGRGKAIAGEVLAERACKVDGTFADVYLPNLFGEHGRPHYNSFVATFCHEIAKGRQATVTVDRAVPLLHAQGAAQALIAAAENRKTHRVDLAGEAHTVSEVRDRLMEIHGLYRTGQIPDLGDSFSVDLFNTYRSSAFPEIFPFRTAVHSDERGALFETVRSHGGTGQSFVSTTRPGKRRGDHYHLRKIERFFVLSGTAEIALRRLYDDQVIRFQVSGREPAFVDMPTMWTHNITNIGSDELVMMFWSDQLLDPSAPDQYPELVESPREGAA